MIVELSGPGIDSDWLRMPAVRLRLKRCPVAHCRMIGYGVSYAAAVESVWWHYVAFHLGLRPEPLWQDRERIRPELYEELAAELGKKHR